MENEKTENTIAESLLQEEPFSMSIEQLSNLADLMQQKNDEPQGLAETEADDIPEELKTITTKNIVATVAYLIGVYKTSMLSQYDADCPGLIEKLEQDQDATLIRYLSYSRTMLIRYLPEINQAIRYELLNLDQLDYFKEIDFQKLAEWGYPVLKANYEVMKYLVDVSKLINENIYKVQRLFPDWMEWSYVRDLFFLKYCERRGEIQSARARYMANRSMYPYKCFINWDPSSNGNILYNDRKFLQILYQLHRDRFTDSSKYTDAGTGLKNGIYDFIDRANKVIMVVDCENSDLFKLYSVLRGLDDQKTGKIEKIVLYDDYHTTEAWDWLEQLTKIPVEHIEVERLVNRKSLVDMEVAVGVCKAYYEDEVDSVILLSSDSDYWPLITGLPSVNFLVMYEFDKCGQAIKDALKEHAIYYCPMDNFCTWDVPKVQKLILFRALENEFPYIIGRDPMEVTRELYEKTRIFVPMEEQTRFCNKYVRTLRTKIMEDGTIGLEIQK